MEAVKTCELTKYYGKARGIKSVNLAVNEGDFFGFIGPNGAGKSTTIRTILGLIAPSGGSATVFGRDIVTEHERVMKDIGYMPSEAMFYGGMRVGDIIRFSADMRGMKCEDEAKRLCDRLQLDVKKKVNELSLGNRKKVSIVCAMQHKPPLYILDEPTSGLDPLMQREFYAILSERNKEGATIFLSSHILSEIEHYCKTAAVIKEGSIVVCDSVENLSHTGTKRVTLRGIKPDDVLRINNIRDIKTEEDKVSFLYAGSAGELIKALSSMAFTDISITEPDLEEIIMNYYDNTTREGQ